MANPIASERFSHEVLSILEETFEHPQGAFLDKGTSLFETLTTISAEEASRPVSANCASIAAQVAHIHFYIDLVLQFIRGENPGHADWGHIWHTVEKVTPEEWEASKTRLREAYLTIHDRITNFPAVWDIENSLSGTIALVAHAAYHLGEIRQALCTLRNDGVTS